MHPEAKQVAIVGLGTGMTAKAVGAFPVSEIDVLEIEPAIVEAAKFFDDHNGNILRDRRMRLVFTDGRNYILAARKRYDIIAAEPSNPWIAGIANLYTREFYEAVRSSGLHETLGAVNAKLGLWEQSANAYSRAVRFSAQNLEARRLLGVALTKVGRLSEAEERFREVLALSPGDAAAWQELEKLGKAYYR